MKKYIVILLISVLLVTPTVTEARPYRSYPYTHPHIYVTHNVTHIDWFNTVNGTYVIYKYVPTKTPFGVNYKPTVIWWKYITVGHIKLVFKETGYSYKIVRVN